MGGPVEHLLPQLVVVDPVFRVGVKGPSGGVYGGPGVFRRTFGGRRGYLACVCRIFPIEFLAADSPAVGTVEQKTGR